ncbi:MAG: CCE_0567 family metalloprotein [Crocosphaera sp.]|nr:CCE_0567 family metalloprotein [Crocosphaera sp.]
MTVATENNPTPEAVADLKKKVRKLNSKAGQMKMDLHDLAEGLPTDYENLLETAQKTYDIFRELDQLKKKLNIWEETLK